MHKPSIRELSLDMYKCRSIPPFILQQQLQNVNLKAENLTVNNTFTYRNCISNVMLETRNKQNHFTYDVPCWEVRWVLEDVSYCSVEERNTIRAAQWQLSRKLAFKFSLYLSTLHKHLVWSLLTTVLSIRPEYYPWGSLSTADKTFTPSMKALAELNKQKTS